MVWRLFAAAPVIARVRRDSWICRLSVVRNVAPALAGASGPEMRRGTTLPEATPPGADS